MKTITKIGFGGGCHWCTEAVFSALKGVVKVEQGFIAPLQSPASFSEAVIVHFYPDEIAIKNLMAIHLHTHQSTRNHSMREKYRSAIYYFQKRQEPLITKIIGELQKEFELPIITKALAFGKFNPSKSEYQNYYYKDPNKPFCKTHITPKLTLVRNKFPIHVKDKAQKVTNQ